MRSIELLAPARNLQCGIEAIRHGADAVYIGASHYGARAAAGNSLDDIAQLVQYAHTFHARIYVTLNTLLRDDELPRAVDLAHALHDIGVDALIMQDTRLREVLGDLLPLHASTQMDNRTPEQVRRLWQQGYEQTVLARELSLQEIRTIHFQVPEMPLEVFVHGALCVCYSGRCYASEYCFGRSANRGECAQFCRLPFNLEDEEGRMLLRQQHLLSLRDMNRSAHLEALMDAGASSFKIEGRLKDVTYVKNITAYYRQQIDAILQRRSDDYCRSSLGISSYTFTPRPQASFNRGFTDYFLHGRTHDLFQPLTPKSLGEPVNPDQLRNGDGICYIQDQTLQGFNISSPADIARARNLSRTTQLWRNCNIELERTLSRPSADRLIPVAWLVEDTPDGFRLTLSIAGLPEPVCADFAYPHQEARTPQEPAIRRQLLRLGDTPYSTTEQDITIRMSAAWFIPASVLGEWRRTMCHLAKNTIALQRDKRTKRQRDKGTWRHGDMDAFPADTTVEPGTPLMTCRFCLRHALGCCPKESGEGKESREVFSTRSPWLLVLADGRRFPLRFDCQRCEMQVLAPR